VRCHFGFNIANDLMIMINGRQMREIIRDHILNERMGYKPSIQVLWASILSPPSSQIMVSARFQEQNAITF
jgi:hypothetical protein